MSDSPPLDDVYCSIASDMNSCAIKQPQNFICNFEGCSSAFSRKWKLDRHICSHTGERPFKCSEVSCCKSYQSSSHLQRHLKTAHLKLDRLPCTYESCLATFTCKSSLIKHCKNHGESRIFKCSKCPVSFLNFTKFRNHEKLHKASLRFHCSVCNTIWFSQTLLRRHMRSHAVLKCEFINCPFICTSRNEVRKHEKIEHPSVFICDYCKKSYSNKGQLREHITIHLPTEHRGLFICPHKRCARSYFQSRNLRHHLKVFHNKPRYYCNYCHLSYYDQVGLNKHVKRLHGQNKEPPEKLVIGLANIPPLNDSSSSEAPMKRQCVLEVISRTA